ncbi:MAG: hypothetical protein WCR17_07190 [Candidatus Methanomethylophilaceae archaeon]
MNELTKYNKVIGIMEQCQVGDYLWVKAEEAEQQIAYWKRCVETSKTVHQIDNETIRKQLDSISELQIDVQDWKDSYYSINSECCAMLSQSIISEREAKKWKATGICCFLIALAEAIYIGVKLL